MIDNSIFIAFERCSFSEAYYWVRARLGPPRNMLFKTYETESSWEVRRERGGHRFIFDNLQDLDNFKEYLNVPLKEDLFA